MRTYLECFGCFLNHGLDIARRAGLNEEDQRLVLNRVARHSGGALGNIMLIPSSS